MSEYQYYEFCSIHSPLTRDARKEMSALSSRANINTHNASYVYHYGNFRGNPKQILLKYFDVFFYISNFGTTQLMFKYNEQQVNQKAIERYCINHVISCEKHDNYVVLDVSLNSEESFGWTDGDGLLPDLLPLYDEIKANNYQFLQLATCIHKEFSGNGNDYLENMVADLNLSPAQAAFLSCATDNYSFA